MNRAALSRVASYALVLFLLAGNAAAGIQQQVRGDAIANLPDTRGEEIRVKLALDASAEPRQLVLERFEAFAPNAVIAVYGADEKELARLPIPAIRYYRGTVAGDDGSLVFLAVDRGRVTGFVFEGERRYAIGSRPRFGLKNVRERIGTDLLVQEVDDADAIPLDGETFSCGVEGRNLTQGRPTLSSITNALPRDPQSDGALPTGTATWTLNLAIDTDYELYVNSGSVAGNVSTFIANLVAAAGTIYRRDLKTDLYLSFLGVQTSSSDPFLVVPGQAGTWDGGAVTWSSLHALLELGDRWHLSPPAAASGLPRSSTILVSGKSQLAGIAWVGTICGGDFAYNGHWGGRYAFCGGIDPPADLSVPNPDANSNYTAPSTNYWPLLQFAHELGHNVGSDHTHCMQLSASDQTTYARTFVDTCYNGQSADGCFGGTQTVPAEKGTIMSYCHLRSGGGTNTRFTFGKSGEASYIVPSAMQSEISSVTPTLSTISAPASVSAGASGIASVTSVAGITYTWTISNGSINSGQGTASLNFTATTNPVTLTVKATNANGCSMTDLKSVSVTDACNQPAITSHPAAQAINTGAQASLSVAATGTATLTYQWYRGASGVITDPVVGATAATLNTSPASTTSYWVRVTNNCGTADSAAATVTVTAPCNVPAISAHPAPQSINSGAQATLSVTASGTATLTYQWYRGTSGTISDPVSGATSATLNISPTSTTTYWVRVTNGCGTANSTAATVTVNASASTTLPQPDFNSNGHDDLVWRNTSTGANAVWLMSGTTRASVAYPLTVADLNWKISAVGDFNADGKADLVWRNTSTGANAVWLMNGVTRTAAVNLLSIPTSWSLVGSGDFNGDGKSDILWREAATGKNAVWLMNGTTRTASVNLLSVAAPWQIAGAGDFNADGKSDIVWRNSSTGANVVWLMNGTTRTAAVTLLTVSDTKWRIGAIGDYNNDGDSDLVWRNDATGANAVWIMDGTTRTSVVNLLSQAGPWTMVGPR